MLGFKDSRIQGFKGRVLHSNPGILDSSAPIL
jgi:hypothetical protein